MEKKEKTIKTPKAPKTPKEKKVKASKYPEWYIGRPKPMKTKTFEFHKPTPFLQKNTHSGQAQRK